MHLAGDHVNHVPFSIQMFLYKELNSHLKSGYSSCGLCVLPFSTSLWNNLLGKFSSAHQVLKLQNRTVRVMSGVGPRSSCRSLFRKLNILAIA